MQSSIPWYALVIASFLSATVGGLLTSYFKIRWGRDSAVELEEFKATAQAQIALAVQRAPAAQKLSERLGRAIRSLQMYVTPSLWVTIAGNKDLPGGLFDALKQIRDDLRKIAIEDLREFESVITETDITLTDDAMNVAEQARKVIDLAIFDYSTYSDVSSWNLNEVSEKAARRDLQHKVEAALREQLPALHEKLKVSLRSLVDTASVV